MTFEEILFWYGVITFGPIVLIYLVLGLMSLNIWILQTNPKLREILKQYFEKR